MDARVHVATHQHKSTSLYGFDLLHYVQDHSTYAHCAYDAAEYVLTHGGNYPIAQAINAIGLYDRAALEVLNTHRHLTVTAQDDTVQLVMYVNSLGRLHIRPSQAQRPQYSEDDTWVEIGFITIDHVISQEIGNRVAVLLESETMAFAEVKQALDHIYANGELSEVLEEVIDHVEHVESVCFYAGDRFFALMDRYVNLIDDKRNKGFLNGLREKEYTQWQNDEILIVAALHALFLSGRSVRYEEYNGALLTARSLIDRLNELSAAYREAGCEVDVPINLDLFAKSRGIREQTLRAPGKPWLRYRWIYGLNFQKKEKILSSMESSEAHDVYLAEFDEDYRELVSGRSDYKASEYLYIAQLASECLARDVAGIVCDRGSPAVTGWLEYLMEKIVASAVVATGADYGMSSSLRNIGQLVQYDEGRLVEVIHALTPTDFFTCFVSNNFEPRLGEDESRVIATSVQKRMMFNRWHFIPGNLDRRLISKKRHWYYPPLVPDIAVHADMHRAAHNRAMVKFSIRSPGPDMSRPPLQIAGRAFRGFYDVRVVRMEGNEFTTEEILRTRRRTLWLEVVYGVLTSYLMSTGAEEFQIQGFQPGSYLDLLPKSLMSGMSKHTQRVPLISVNA